MNLHHELLDLISTIQVLDKHYDEAFVGIEDDLAELRRNNLYLEERNKVLSMARAPICYQRTRRQTR